MKTNIPIIGGLCPMPVLLIATYNEDGSTNVMNAAWATMLSKDAFLLVLDEEHQTVQNIKRTHSFTISPATSKYLIEADYFGIVSAHHVPHKFDNTPLTSSPSQLIQAPILNEFPICLECLLIQMQYGIIGKIINISIDEEYLIDGKVAMDKLDLICFDPYTRSYYTIGNRVGEAFKDGLQIKKG